MATYFHGSSEIQAAADHGLQTLVLMNPAYVQYASTPPPPPPGNLVFLNSTTANSLSSPHLQAHPPPPHTQQFVGIPLPTSASLDPNSQSMHAHHEISALHGLMPRVQYNLWNSIDPNMAARDSPRAQQGLSLSLSSQKPGFGAPPPQSQALAISGEDMRISGGSSSSASGVTNGVSGMHSVVVSSKYLKAVQEILDEVVNVGNGLKSDSSKKVNGQNKVAGDSSPAAASGDWSSGGKGGAELTTAERQEIQMKKAKLINMLEEVDQRYRQYHHQMLIVISSFEQAAGVGSAKTYTALALKTISKQFRCLKDAIAGQIRAANKNLGEEDNFGGKIEGGSRLKFVDHHLRQQRALQQLGMIQHNAWRPQRGLPEKSVSVLRAWLFEHFLHPYPKDSDKLILAKQAGLTRSQVSNWFINARVRLWKPMVEEMYMEEIKEQEQDGSEDKTSKSEHNEGSISKSSAQQQNGSVAETETKNFKSNNANSTNQNAPSGISISTVSTSPIGENLRNQFSFIGSSELEGITQGSPKKLRRAEMFQSTSSFELINMDVKPNEVSSEQISLKFGNDQRQSSDGGYSIMGEPTNFIGGFGHYPLEEIGRYEAEQYTPRFSGNGVSLTLGLPHCENLSLSGAHQNFLPSQNIQLGRGVEIAEPSHEFGTINTSIPHSSAAYESINIQNRKRFAAQLLPDFVA